MKFKALIDGVHFDPKKGAVKIALVATLHDVSLDELTTLSPKDESVHVTLESEQTKLDHEPKPGGAISLEPGSLEELEAELKAGKIITEFPTEEAEKDVKHTGDAIALAEKEAVKLKEAADRLKKGDEEGGIIKRSVEEIPLDPHD